MPMMPIENRAPSMALLVPHSAPMPGIAKVTATRRSEEHTSELQSLMRISYAVFCLKKKTKRTEIQKTNKMIDYPDIHHDNSTVRQPALTTEHLRTADNM